MKIKFAIAILTLLLVGMVAAFAQEKAAIQAAKPGPFHPGQTITFTVKLNAPLPKDATFDLRISPVSTDQEISLATIESVGGSDAEFRVSGKLPEGAVPGDWHIKVIWLHLAGAGWTTNQIIPNNVVFQVEGKAFPIPTTAQISVEQH